MTSAQKAAITGCRVGGDHAVAHSPAGHPLPDGRDDAGRTHARRPRAAQSSGRGSHGGRLSGPFRRSAPRPRATTPLLAAPPASGRARRAHLRGRKAPRPAWNGAGGRRRRPANGGGGVSPGAVRAPLAVGPGWFVGHGSTTTLREPSRGWAAGSSAAWNLGQREAVSNEGFHDHLSVPNQGRPPPPGGRCRRCSARRSFSPAREIWPASGLEWVAHSRLREEKQPTRRAEAVERPLDHAGVRYGDDSKVHPTATYVAGSRPDVFRRVQDDGRAQ